MSISARPVCPCGQLTAAAAPGPEHFFRVGQGCCCHCRPFLPRQRCCSNPAPLHPHPEMPLQQQQWVPNFIRYPGDSGFTVHRRQDHFGKPSSACWQPGGLAT